jgi:hypothetical protein
VVNDGTTTETQTLQIMNAMGAIVAERVVTLAAGEVGSLDFAIASARMEIHGKASPGGFPADLQIFDSTSMRTTALVETFLPSPPETTVTLVSPSIGLVAGQVARLSVVNTNTMSETETLSIVDSRGITVKATTLTVAPGRAAFIQVRTSRPRVEIHGMISAPRRPSRCSTRKPSRPRR